MGWLTLYKSEAEECEHWFRRMAERKFFLILGMYGDGQIRFFWKAVSRYQSGLLVRHKRDKKRIFTIRTQVREMIEYIFEDRRSICL
jgi:hypothetical protein